MAKQRFVIKRWRPPSLNVLMRMHHMKRARAVVEAKRLIDYTARASATVTQAVGPRRVSINVVLGKGQRAYDADNALKLVLDGLVSAGLLVDDSAAYCTLGAVTFERAGKGGVPGTEITLEDL